MNISQRTRTYEQRPRERTRAAVTRSFFDLASMTPLSLVRLCIEDGLLPDLQGGPCPNVLCEQQTRWHCTERVLGQLSPAAVEDASVDRFAVENICYRCKACRCRVPVTRGCPLFRGSTWPAKSMLAMWLCVEGVSLSTACRMLNVGDDLARRWYRTAQVVMSSDALRRQGKIQHGCNGDLTTDIEADESCFSKWSVYDEQNQERVYYWYVWLGVVARGAMETLWLEPIGVTSSRGEPRVPPLDKERWEDACKALFKEGKTNGVLMTDGALTYRLVKPAGIVEHFTVNHTEHEYSRSEDIIKDVVTKERRAGMAGTQFLDHEWRLLKRQLPETGINARTDEDRARAALYIRAAQWRRMIGNAEMWPAFAVAAAKWMCEELARRLDTHRHLHPMAWHRREKKARAPKQEDNLTQKAAKVEPVEEAVLEPKEQSLWADRYFERQGDAPVCGRHALNNLLGGPQFSDADLNIACDLVLAETGDSRSCHVSGGGWYSHSVLIVAFDTIAPPTWRMLGSPLLPSSWQHFSSCGGMVGVVLNHNGSHWSAICKHNGHVWHADSQCEPAVLGQEGYARLFRKHPMAFPVVANEYQA